MVRLFPVCAGMNRTVPTYAACGRALPRVRGDGPVGGMNMGDRFTDEVGEALIDYLRDDVKIVVNKPEETVND